MNIACPGPYPSSSLPGFRRAVACATVILLSLSQLCWSADVNDLDRDGVADHLDLDQDNDGLLNQHEGYRSVVRAALTDAQTLLSVATAGPSNQSTGSRYAYRLLGDSGTNEISFDGTIQSTTTRVNWGVHENLPKIRNQADGLTVVLWQFSDPGQEDTGLVDVDLTVADLDADRRESILIKRKAIVAYSISETSNVRVSDHGVDQLKFTAIRSNAGLQDDSVTLHLRGVRQIVIGYESEPNKNSLAGVENDAAGFRHSFLASVLANYQRVESSQDSDFDGIPDHRDLDSDNDGINDVDFSAIVDADANGMADGIVNGKGMVEITMADTTADLVSGIDDQLFGSDVSDADGDGIIAVYDANPEQFGEGDTDTDGDGLSDDRELALGTDINSRDTDRDGVSDADEVVIYHTNPLGPELDGAEDNAVLLDSDKDGLADEVEGMGDADDDGVPNRYDIDSDNDGIADVVEAGFSDLNGDGMIDSMAGDELSDVAMDFDADGIANFLDLDSDQDNLTDLQESGGVDFDLDGRVDAFIDRNGDGWDDRFFGLTVAFFDTDDDGNPDVLDKFDANLLVSDERPGLVMMDDVGTVQTDADSVHTGIEGKPGCALSANRSETSFTLLLLLISAVLGICRRRMMNNIEAPI